MKTKHALIKRSFAVLMIFTLLVGLSLSNGFTLKARASVKASGVPVKQLSVPAEDGVYYADIELMNATRDTVSMGNTALRGSSSYEAKQTGDVGFKPLIVVKDGKATAILEYMPMGYLMYYGFLLELNSINTTLFNLAPVEESSTYTQATVLAEHRTQDGKVVFDQFNDPDLESAIDGTDPIAHMRPDGYGHEAYLVDVTNKAYPHILTADATPIMIGEGDEPVTAAEYTWEHAAYVSVFVPVMFSIATYTGEQYARLQLDWTSLEKVENPEENVQYQLYLATQIEKGNYTDESYNALQSVIAEIEKTLSNVWPSQQIEVPTGFNPVPVLNLKQFNDDENKQMAEELVDAMNSLEEKGDKSSLETLISEAEIKKASDYTDASWKDFEEKLAVAKEVMADDDAGVADVTEAINELQKAMDALVERTETTEPSEDPSESDEQVLDRFSLADGVYSIYGEMIKTNRQEKSMANDAINHTVKLTVEDGKYYLTMDFHGLAYLNKFGYLAELSYYDAGYKYGQYGSIEGVTKAAQVLSTQKNADGSDVKDEFNQQGGIYEGKLYPDQIKFPLVQDALNDENGYVPLHVFVPVMEDISDGTGDQDVLLQLDWSTLKETTEDDPAFDNDEPVEQSPAVNYADPETGVRVSADKGVFEEGVQIVINEITSGADYDQAASSLNEVGKKFKLYNIEFLDADGNKVDANGVVTIKFPITAGYDADSLAVYRMDDGNKILMRGDVEDNYYTVITRTSGIYSMVEKGSTITDAENSADIPKTGDVTDFIPLLILALAAAAMTGVTIAVRKTKNAQV